MNNNLQQGGGLGRGGGTPQQPDLTKEEIRKLESFRCKECGNETFISALQMKVIPSVHPASPPGGGGVQPVQVFACLGCGRRVDLEKFHGGNEEQDQT